VQEGVLRLHRARGRRTALRRGAGTRTRSTPCPRRRSTRSPTTSMSLRMGSCVGPVGHRADSPGRATSTIHRVNTAGLQAGSGPGGRAVVQAVTIAHRRRPSTAPARHDLALAASRQPRRACSRSVAHEHRRPHGRTRQAARSAAGHLMISLVWIAVVGLSRVPEPVLTLVFAGLVYAGSSIVLSATLSPILEGELQGPLATPFGIGVLSVLVVNAIWGATTGAAALLVRKMRG
jgi:hypothetical protein